MVLRESSMAHRSSAQWFACAVGVCLLSLPALAQGPDLSSKGVQVIPAATGAPRLDGKLNDPAWKNVKPFSPFLIAGTLTPVAAPFQTEVKAVYRGRFLYFGIKCHDPSAPKLKALAKRHDGPVWQDDAIEIFINPEDKGYYQLLVSHTGVRADLGYSATRGGGKIGWNAEPDWSAKTAVGKGFWTAEVKVPFDALWKWKFAPTHGERFRLKICRLIYEKSGNTGDRHFTSWNDLPGGVFSGNFGWRPVLLGGENLLPDADFARWVGRKTRRIGISLLFGGYWTLEAGSRTRKGETVGTLEVLKDPAPGISHALKVTRVKPGGQNPRLFVRAPLRPGHRYRFSAKVKGKHWLNLTVNSRPWVRHFMKCFKPPKGGWAKFTEVNKEFEVGQDSSGREAMRFLYLWIEPKALGRYMLAEPKLVEIQSAEPAPRADMLKHHGMKSLAESNFGVKPFRRLNLDKHNGYDAPRVIYRDTATGVEVWKVTHLYRLDRLLGTGQKSWSADGKFFAFTSYWRPMTNNVSMLTADATRVLAIRARGVAAPGMWSAKGHVYYSMPYSGIYAYDAETRKTTTLFKLAADKKFPGRNWIKFHPESMQVMQYAWQFGKKAVIRIWDLKTMTYRDIPTKTLSADPYKPKDWLYGAGFVNADVIRYGMNHIPHLSKNNIPQGWTCNLKTGEYAVDKDVHDRASHGTRSPSGKVVGYFRGGLAYKPRPGAKKIHIGGLGGDGHMMFAYQDRIAISGDVSDDALVSMIYPETRNVVYISYAQNFFTGYYGSIIFVSMSPDVTKLCFTSDMMGYRDLYWGVTNYPMPPVNVRTERAGAAIRVRWDKPEWSAEIGGYRVYRSDRSGRGFRLITPQPVAGTEFMDTTADPRKTHFYVVRSQEASSLVSKAHSNEAVWNAPASRGPYRIFVEAERFRTQQVPFRIRTDGDAVNEKHMCVKPVNEEPKDGAGALTFDVAVPASGAYRLLARVKRGMGSGADCRLTVGDGPKAGVMSVKSPAWRWQAFDAPLRLAAGRHTLKVTGAGVGLCLDRLALSSDPRFTPKGKGGDVDESPPTPVAGLKSTDRTHFDIRLAWTASADPEFHHYQVHRKRGPGVKAVQAFLVGSPSKPEFLDYNLRPGEAYAYVVTAVDNWGNPSKASSELTVSTVPLRPRVLVEIPLAGVPGIARTAQLLKGERTEGLYRFESSRANPRVLRIPFEVPADGEYVVWLHAAAAKARHTCVCHWIDRRSANLCRWSGRDYKKGQTQSERVQWDRLTATIRDAGTVYTLKKGKHALLLGNLMNNACDLVLDKVLITNDLSHIPPGKRFMP